MRMVLKRADLHLHTRFSRWNHLRIIRPRDSYTDPLDAYLESKRRGMDFVAFTDHDTIDGALDLLARRPDLEREIIIGEEVSTRFTDTGQVVHVNVFGVDERTHRDIAHLRGNVHELVAWLRQRGLFHVLNHPFQTYRLERPASVYIEQILDLFDCFEAGNGTQPARHNRAVAEMLDYAAGRWAGKHGVGGSDAHDLRDVALYHTEALVPEAPGTDPRAGWLAAVARGEGRAVGRSRGPAGLTANVYRIIGRYYLSLRDPEVRRRMRAINYAAAAVLAPACVAGLPAFLSLGNWLRLEAVTLYLRRALARMRRPDEARLRSPELLQDPLD